MGNRSVDHPERTGCDIKDHQVREYFPNRRTFEAHRADHLAEQLNRLAQLLPGYTLAHNFITYDR